jgi:hypothetical protein
MGAHNAGPPRIILGVAGKAGAGKDTLADALVKHHGFFKASFALALKLEVILKYGFTRSEVFETKPPEVRKVLQEYGYAARAKDPLHWVRQLESYIAGKKLVVIPDVRFRNEADAILWWGGQNIRVLNAHSVYPLAGTPAALHESETALDSYPMAYVVNTRVHLPEDLARSALAQTFPLLL